MGRGARRGHAQASLERGTRGAGDGPEGTQAGSLCHQKREGGAGGGPRGWDAWDGWEERRLYHASRVTRQEEGGGGWGERSPGGGGFAPLAAAAYRRKCGKRAGVPLFFFKKGGVGGSRRTCGAETGADARAGSVGLDRGAARAHPRGPVRVGGRLAVGNSFGAWWSGDTILDYCGASWPSKGRGRGPSGTRRGGPATGGRLLKPGATRRG